MFRNIHSLIWLRSVFSSLFLETILGSMVQTIQFSDFSLEKYNFIPCPLKALKQQFFQMVDAGNMEAPEASSSTLTPTNARKF